MLILFLAAKVGKVLSHRKVILWEVLDETLDFCFIYNILSYFCGLIFM